jgi:hypothetical protein
LPWPHFEFPSFVLKILGMIEIFLKIALGLLLLALKVGG